MSQRRTQKSTAATQRLTQALASSQASNVHHHDDGDDDDEAIDNSQQPASTLSEQEHNQYVANVVKYILAADQSKIPIARSALSKCTNYQGSSKNFRAVLKSAEDALLNVFGYKVIDVDGKIILLNELSEQAGLKFSDEIELRHALLFLVLSHIFMNNEVCTETSLMNFLSRVNIIIEGNVKHPEFGNVMEIITNDFVKEKYIDVSKPDKAEREKEFRWGKRAEKELPARAVMQFASLVYSRRDIETWPQQFQAMQRMEDRTGTTLQLEDDGEENDDENGVMEVDDD